MEKIVIPVVNIFMGTLMSYVPEEKVRDAADNLLDKLEDLVDGTGTKIDDAMLEPVFERIREMFNIPDGED
ncbi:MAG: hypothetical protein MI684_00800 [Chlorobiales bacterium]|nr:hypothetical protein [Chlorobiales bacterium]